MDKAPDKRWFHPNIDGVQAKNLLIEKGLDGSFLVRFSTGEKHKPNPQLTLSVRRRINTHKDPITHIKIRRHEDGFYDLFGGEPFASLSDLIQFYMKNGLKERNGEVIELRSPLNCEDPTNERWFHGKISGPDSALKLMPCKGGAYLVRESQNNPGSYCLSVKTDDTVTQIKIGKTGKGFDLHGSGGRSFNTLTELLEYYTANPIIDATQKVVHLKYPLLITTFPVEQIFPRIADLKRLKNEEWSNKLAQNGFWEEFNSIQQQEFTHLIPKNEGTKPENLNKNCFKNIIPFDYSRVKLQSEPTSPGADYINANWIKGDDDKSMMRRNSSEEKEMDPVLGMVGSENANKEYKRLFALYSSKKQYIATQGCLKSTTADFWQMIWQENIQVIALMHQNFTYTSKMNCIKFSKYWPENPENIMASAGYTMIYGNFTVTTKFVKDQIDYIFRELHVRKNEPGDTQEKKIYHYHFNGWPEHGIPKRTDRLLKFLYDVDRRYRSLSQVPLCLMPSLTDTALNLFDGNQGSEGAGTEPVTSTTQQSTDHFPPILVQCHSGIGRTGSLIVIDMIIDQIKRKGFDCEIDIHRTVQSVRNQRSGMIQTEAQYKFIYDAVAQHIDTIRDRLDAEMKSPRDYTNIMLGGEYVRAYAFQPTSRLPKALNLSAPKKAKTNRVHFSAILESPPIRPSYRNRHTSERTSLESHRKKEHCLPTTTIAQRQRHTTEQFTCATSSLDLPLGSSDMSARPCLRSVSLEPRYVPTPGPPLPPRPMKRNSKDILQFEGDFGKLLTGPPLTSTEAVATSATLQTSIIE